MTTELERLQEENRKLTEENKQVYKENFKLKVDLLTKHVIKTEKHILNHALYLMEVILEVLYFKDDKYNPLIYGEFVNSVIRNESLKGKLVNIDIKKVMSRNYTDLTLFINHLRRTNLFENHDIIDCKLVFNSVRYNICFKLDLLNTSVSKFYTYDKIVLGNKSDILLNSGVFQHSKYLNQLKILRTLYDVNNKIIRFNEAFSSDIKNNPFNEEKYLYELLDNQETFKKAGYKIVNGIKVEELDVNCSVCMEPNKTGPVLRCRHKTCTDCIVKNYLTNLSMICPLCRGLLKGEYFYN